MLGRIRKLKPVVLRCKGHVIGRVDAGRVVGQPENLVVWKKETVSKTRTDGMLYHGFPNNRPKLSGAAVLVLKGLGLAHDSADPNKDTSMTVLERSRLCVEKTKRLFDLNRTQEA